jgi:hypothetical protein
VTFGPARPEQLARYRRPRPQLVIRPHESMLWKQLDSPFGIVQKTTGQGRFSDLKIRPSVELFTLKLQSVSTILLTELAGGQFAPVNIAFILEEGSPR